MTYAIPPSLRTIADRCHVHPDDARILLVAEVGDGAELDPDRLTEQIADALAGLLAAEERDLVYPPNSVAADLATEYRQTRDPALLDELRARRHPDIARQLEFEQPRPDDPPSVQRTRAHTRAAIDTWIATGPEDPLPPGRHAQLGGGWGRSGNTIA